MTPPPIPAVPSTATADKPPPSDAAPFYRLKATVEYFGPAFHGFAACPQTAVTVQAVLQAALQRCTRSPNPIPLTAAGRTDTGVHALANVCSLALPASTVQRLGGVQRLLFLWNQAIYHLRSERSLHVVSLQRVAPAFHARHSAVQRHYLYRILSGGFALFERERAWHVAEQLDVAAMRAAAAEILSGTHDFRSLVSHRADDPRPTLRHLTALCIHTHQPPHIAAPYHSLSPQHPSTLVHCHFSAPSFLHHQCRNLAALLVEAGRGRLGVDEVRALLRGGRGRQWNPIGTAPAHGLWLTGIEYERESEKQWLMPEDDAPAEEIHAAEAGDGRQVRGGGRSRWMNERWAVNESGVQDDYILKLSRR